MQDFEKLGVFYLGRLYDVRNKSGLEDLLLYDSRDLVTHAVCIGMTGSGKTGLCVSLIEEAAIDGIPAIVIDPKGDITNLLLTFPELRSQDFAPWINEEEALKKGLSPQEYANQQADLWKCPIASFWASLKTSSCSRCQSGDMPRNLSEITSVPLSTSYPAPRPRIEEPIVAALPMPRRSPAFLKVLDSTKLVL